MPVGLVWIPAVKNLVLGEFAILVAALLAVGQSHLWVLERFEQALQPVRVDRVDVRAGDDDQVAGRGSQPPVQGTPEGKFRRRDVLHFRPVLCGDGVGRTRVSKMTSTSRTVWCLTPSRRRPMCHSSLKARTTSE